MRCPKCGYISFDYLEVCQKCKKNIKGVADQLQGGVLSIDPPSFLNFDLDSDRDSADGPMEEYIDSSEELTEQDDFIDADLEVLFEEDTSYEGGSETELDEAVSVENGEEEFEITLDAEESGLSIDLDKEEDLSLDFNTNDDEIVAELSEIEEGMADEANSQDIKFADAEDEDELVIKFEEEEELEIELPDELADLSDLAPPGSAPKMEPVTDLDSLEISLDGLELNLEAEKSAAKKALSAEEEELVLSLDNIDLSDTLNNKEKNKKPKTKTMDMDADLDFDLDLGGLSIHDDL